MINAHCEHNPVVYCNKTKLYKFRIFELSEPFCDVPDGQTMLSRSCDNVAQRLKQAERNKRRSQTFAWNNDLQTRAPNRRRQKPCNRSHSLPIDLSECGRDFFRVNVVEEDGTHVTSEEKHVDRHVDRPGERHVRESSLRRRINGFNRESIETAMHLEAIAKLTDDNEGKTQKEDRNDELLLKHCAALGLEETGASDTGTEDETEENHVISDVLTEDHCTQIKSNLRGLSSRFDEKDLQSKSKEELISVILELQDALRLATDD